ncbi:hypothetical protein DFH94DRAFT_706593 [Russula ochroleuca]|jgi:hypothetical protein|uniref:Uncharacterized protein n=1 Tax=Russula ochroleuca TaxID=152965 RepID=A0A9P5TE79_9AGAM|nr:hypothetical protein DFH94DRAFT_706593 [Russula ochroleuca]
MHWVVRGTCSLFSSLCYTSQISILELTRFDSFPFHLLPFSEVTLDVGIGPENLERLVTTPSTQRAQIMTLLRIPYRCPIAASPDQNQNNNVLFSAVSTLTAQLTTLHPALPPRTAFLSFSGQRSRDVSALAARCAQYQANRNQGTGVCTAGTDGNAPLRWRRVVHGDD